MTSMNILRPYDSARATLSLAEAQAAWEAYIRNSAATLFVVGLTRSLGGVETTTAVVWTREEALAEAANVAAYCDLTPTSDGGLTMRTLRPYDTQSDSIRIRGAIREAWLTNYRNLFTIPTAELKALQKTRHLPTVGNALEIPTARAFHGKWTGMENRPYTEGGDVLTHGKIVEVKFFDKGARFAHETLTL